MSASSFSLACSPFEIGGQIDALSLSGCGQSASTLQSVYTDPIIESTTEGEAGTSEEIATKGVGTASGAQVGVGSHVADDIQIYTIPITYGMPVSIMGGKEYLNITARLTYVDFDLGELGFSEDSESGMGDSVLSVEHFIDRKGLVLRSGISIKFPTGDADKYLGNDSTDYGLTFSATKYINKISYTGGLSYIIRGTGDSQIHEFDYGNVMSLRLGGAYQLSKSWKLGVDAIYVDIDETENKTFDNSAIPAYTTVDLAPSITWTISNIDLQLQYRYAVSESEDGGDIATTADELNGTTTPLDAEEREDSISLNLSSKF